MRKILVMGLVAGVVAAPAAFAVGPSAHKPVTPAKHAKPTPVVSYLFKGTVMTAVNGDNVIVVSPVRGTNIHGRRAFYGMTTPSINVKIAAGTKVFARVVNPDGTKRFVRENPALMLPGDVVYFHIRAKKGLKADEITNAARWIRDLTPNPAPAPV